MGSLCDPANLSFTDVWNLLSDGKDYAIVALDLFELAMKEIAVQALETIFGKHGCLLYWMNDQPTWSTIRKFFVKTFL